ncbi:Rossmann-like and DUF2520 domain-containing protein [Pontibacter sp. CAU 1760]
MPHSFNKRIALVGAGNMAWHLGQAFAAAGHTVTAVYSRSATSRTALVSLLPHAQPMAIPDFSDTDTDVVLLAVPDAVLASVAATVRVAPGTIVVHTSGSQPLSVLEVVKGARIGVFYPLQTFSKAKPVDLTHTPLLLEAEDKEALQQLTQLAHTLSTQVHPVSSQARKQLHLAAVFACNFTNHLLGISRQLLEEARLPQTLLQPLITETFAKASQQHPFTVQTGPAVRGDGNVMQEHLRLLQQHPRYQTLYQQLSDSIQEKPSPTDADEGA